MDENKKSIFPVNADSKSAVIILLIALTLIVGLTFSLWGIWLIDIYAVRICLTLLVDAACAVVAVVAMKLTAQGNKLLPTKHKLWLQILIGFAIAAILCLLMGIVPILCGTSIVGSHTDPSAGYFVISAVQDILFIGLGEEIIFRGYVQNQFEIWLKKCKWLSPLIAAVLFGLWHIINGNLIQVLFTTLVGCVFGYCKYFIKDCSLLSVIIAHGLYDFSIVFLTCFML
ncbi:MAG: CPBP family intramembrane metalloprotease [Clostridiales bacterium]|nr:CPBP family intramembrane metalloprotease [Clostridiales bacterium]